MVREKHPENDFVLQVREKLGSLVVGKGKFGKDLKSQGI